MMLQGLIEAKEGVVCTKNEYRGAMLSAKVKGWTAFIKRG